MRWVGLVAVVLVLVLVFSQGRSAAEAANSRCDVVEQVNWKRTYEVKANPYLGGQGGGISKGKLIGQRFAVPGGWLYVINALEEQTGAMQNLHNNYAIPTFVPDPKSPCK